MENCILPHISEYFLSNSGLPHPERVCQQVAEEQPWWEGCGVHSRCWRSTGPLMVSPELWVGGGRFQWLLTRDKGDDQDPRGSRSFSPDFSTRLPSSTQPPCQELSASQIDGVLCKFPSPANSARAASLGLVDSCCHLWVFGLLLLCQAPP